MLPHGPAHSSPSAPSTPRLWGLFFVALFSFVFRLGLIYAAYAHYVVFFLGFAYARINLTEFAKLMREKLSQQDINRAMLLAFDEIIRELKRLDIETRKAKRAINRRFLNL
jgi:hypothetical protein